MTRPYLVAVLAFVACGPPPPALEVSLSNDSFATSGGNLFNCTSPEFPPDKQALSAKTLECTPPEKNGAFTGASETVSLQYGCGDGHGALIIATCRGDGSGAMSGSVELVLTPDCGMTTADGGVEQVFGFTGLTAGATQSEATQACAAFTNFCPVDNPCAFNQFSATINLSRKDPAH